MLKKRLNTRFKNLSKEELIEVNGGRINIKKGLLDIVDLMNTIKIIANEKKYKEKDIVKDIVKDMPFYHLVRDLRRTIQNT